MSEARIIIMEAIARRTAFAARYNGTVIRLAPHLLFERHDDLFVSALNMDKTWRSDEAPRLGQFKLAGLGDVALIDETFEPIEGFDQTAPRPGDTVILAA